MSGTGLIGKTVFSFTLGFLPSNEGARFPEQGCKQGRGAVFEVHNIAVHCSLRGGYPGITHLTTSQPPMHSCKLVYAPAEV